MFSLDYYNRFLISTNPLSLHAVCSSCILAIRSAFPNLFHIENHETPSLCLKYKVQTQKPHDFFIMDKLPNFKEIQLGLKISIKQDI